MIAATTQPDATRSRLVLQVRAVAPLAIAFAAAAILLRFPPAQYSFYPICPIHQYLHILCPGCGTTRTLAALLHGNIAEAMHLNALTTLLTPIALFYAAACYRRILAHRPLNWPQPTAAALYATLAVTCVFTIIRNL